MTSFRADDFHGVGAQIFKGALLPFLSELESAVVDLPVDEAGVRLHGISPLAEMFAVDGCIGSIAVSVLGSRTRPVRAILFNKTPNTNWSLSWHQDRTICVKERLHAEKFGNWTLKQGMHHVEPPVDLLAQMITLRAHIDDVPAGNAPLLIAPGSHTLGKVSVAQVEDVVRRCGTVACLADAGDLWLYATSILHASESAAAPAMRRVLQVDYANFELPCGLEWLGV